MKTFAWFKLGGNVIRLRPPPKKIYIYIIWDLQEETTSTHSHGWFHLDVLAGSWPQSWLDGFVDVEALGIQNDTHRRTLATWVLDSEGKLVTKTCWAWQIWQLIRIRSQPFPAKLGIHASLLLVCHLHSRLTSLRFNWSFRHCLSTILSLRGLHLGWCHRHRICSLGLPGSFFGEAMALGNPLALAFGVSTLSFAPALGAAFFAAGLFKGPPFPSPQCSSILCLLALSLSAFLAFSASPMWIIIKSGFENWRTELLTSRFLPRRSACLWARSGTSSCKCRVMKKNSKVRSLYLTAAPVRHQARLRILQGKEVKPSQQGKNTVFENYILHDWPSLHPAIFQKNLERGCGTEPRVERCLCPGHKKK